MMRTASGDMEIRGSFGPYFEFTLILATHTQPEVTINSTAAVVMECFNSRVLYLKNLLLGVDVEGVQIVNVTLAQDYNMTLTAGSSGGFAREVDFTPNQTGLLSITLIADYEYTEGNQTSEQSSPFYMFNLVSINEPTYGDLANQNFNLEKEMSNLNTTYQSLNTSYQDLQKWTLFLAITTALFTVTTLSAVRRYRELRKSIRHSQATITPQASSNQDSS
jgi:hypothetical protein